MNVNYLLVLLLSCSTILSMELERNTSIPVGSLMSLKEIVLKLIAAKVKLDVDSGHQLAWFNSAKLPKELAMQVPRALSRYESEFAWRTIPSSTGCLRLTSCPDFIYKDKYFVRPKNEESQADLHSYDLATNEYLGKIDNYFVGKQKKIFAVNNFLANVDDNRLARAWDLDSLSLIFEKVVENTESFAIAPDSTYIFCGLKDGRIKIIEIANPDNNIFIRAHTSAIQSIELNANILLIASATDCIAWQVKYTQDGITLNKLFSTDTTTACEIRLTPDGRHLIVTNYDFPEIADDEGDLFNPPTDDESNILKGMLFIFDISEKTCVYAGKIKLCHDLDFQMSSDGKTLFLPEMGVTALNLFLVDVCTGSMIRTVPGKDLINALETEYHFAISKDNSSILFYNPDSNIVVRESLDLKDTLEDTLKLSPAKNEPKDTTCLLS